MITDSRNQLGLVLRNARSHAGLSLRGLARQTGIDNAEISRYESGDRVPPVAAATLLDTVLRTGGALRVLTESVRQDQDMRRRGRVPQILPPLPAQLVGRDELLAELDRYDRNLIALDGPAGVGKTALVAHWANRDRTRWPDGILTVNMRGYAPDAPPASQQEITTDLLRGIGLQVPDRADEQLRLLHQALAERRMLIVLDDAVDAAHVRPILTCGPSTVVVTSRHSLGGLKIRNGAARHVVEPLDNDAAAGLLATLTGCTIPASAAATRALDDIAAACDSNPLAIHAAAVAMTDGTALPPADVAHELIGPNRLDVLTAAAADDPTAALRVVLAASTRRLSPATQSALTYLAGCDQESWPLDDLLAELGDTAHTLVRELTREHLAEMGPDGLTLPGLVRCHALSASIMTTTEPLCA